MSQSTENQSARAPLRLPDSIYSPRQILQLRRELEQLSEQVQRGLILDKLGLDRQNQTVTQSEATDKLSPTLLEFLQTTAPSNLNSADVQGLIDAVDAITQWPTLHLTLSAPLAKTQRAELIQWFRGSLSPALLFQFSFDPGLIGGLVVRTPARQYDWSYRSRLLANAADLAEVVSHVG